MKTELFFSLATALVAIIYGGFLVSTILKKSKGGIKMQEISNAIEQGAKAYLSRQYKTIAPIAVILFIVLL